MAAPLDQPILEVGDRSLRVGDGGVVARRHLIGRVADDPAPTGETPRRARPVRGA